MEILLEQSIILQHQFYVKSSNSSSESTDEVSIGKARENPSGYKRNIIKKARLLVKNMITMLVK